MIGFASFAVVLTLATLALLTRSLWWPRRHPASADTAQRDSIDALRRRIAELDAAHAAGSITDAEHAQAREALDKRIVATVVDGPSMQAAAKGAAARRPLALMLGLAFSVCTVAALGYLVVGTPQALSPQLAAAPGASAPPIEAASITPQQVELLIERLAIRLREQPGDIEGWTILGRSNAVLGRFEAAAAAFKQALALRPEDSMLMAHYADALATARQGFAGEPDRLIARALAVDPNNLKALALAGSAAFEREDYAAALRQWESMARLAPTDEFREQIQAGIGEAKRRLAGQGAVSSTASDSSASTAATTDSTPVGASAKSIEGSVTLSQSLAGKARPDDTLFVFARVATGGGIPLAVVRKKVKDLPLNFTLDDSMAMSPQHTLSTATGVVVSARISRSGNAMPASGDLQGVSVPVQPGARGVRIEITDIVGL
ncbi:MAG: c-type cytochrome biogenesis protein CcmI [Burkholderiaceae bacterium]